MAANSENSSRPSLESFRLCVQSICPKFNVSSLKESQFQALYSFICGEEVFVNLPTGSGKSLIFQLAPLVHTWMHEHILSTGDLRHQYGIFGGESQTSLFPFRSSLRDVNERRLYSQANNKLNQSTFLLWNKATMATLQYSIKSGILFPVMQSVPPPMEIIPKQ